MAILPAIDTLVIIEQLDLDGKKQRPSYSGPLVSYTALNSIKKNFHCFKSCTELHGYSCIIHSIVYWYSQLTLKKRRLETCRSTPGRLLIGEVWMPF